MAKGTTTATKVRKAEFDALLGVYMFVVENWAVSAREVAKVRTAGDVKKANALLNKLGYARLVEGTHVNNERETTWQSYYDIENSDATETVTGARADFNAAFAVGRGKVAPAKRGGSGPRYSPAQIERGVELTRAGESAVKVAEAVGVKSPSYFRNVCKARIAEQDAKRSTRRAKHAKAVKRTEAAVKARSRRAGGDGPQGLKDLLKLG